jgi:hypothetical protein
MSSNCIGWQPGGRKKAMRERKREWMRWGQGYFAVVRQEIAKSAK